VRKDVWGAALALSAVVRVKPELIERNHVVALYRASQKGIKEATLALETLHRVRSDLFKELTEGKNSP